MAGGLSGWNYVGGRYVSRAEAIAAGITPPPTANERKKAARKLARANRKAAENPPPGPGPTIGDPGFAQQLAPPSAPPPATGGKVIQFERPTLEEALNRVRQAPAPASDLPAPTPPGIADPTPAPPLADITPIHRQDEPEGFAQLGGKLTAGGAVALCGMILRKRGYEPNDPDDEDVERLERGFAKAIRQQIGDQPIPLWMELSASTALLYLSMSLGARRIREQEATPEGDPSPAPAPSGGPPSPPPAAPAPGPRINPAARMTQPTSAKGGIVTARAQPIDLGPPAA